MKIDFEIKNYRCFPDSEPLRFTIGNDWTAFIGVNNSGKSSILKFFYEFRTIFQRLSILQSLCEDIRNGSIAANLIGCNVSDVCNNANNRKMLVKISLHSNPSNEITLSCDQNTQQFSIVSIFGLDMIEFKGTSHVQASDGFLAISGRQAIDQKSLLSAIQRLSDTVYIGSFRNILNTGASTYFDINVGTQFVNVWEAMYAGSDRKSRDHCQEVIHSIENLLGIRRLELRPMPGNNAIIVHIDGKSYQLAELGS